MIWPIVLPALALCTVSVTPEGEVGGVAEPQLDRLARERRQVDVQLLHAVGVTGASHRARVGVRRPPAPFCWSACRLLLLCVRAASAVSCCARQWTSPVEQKACFVANIKSQLKRIKTNEKARLRNKAVKSSLKTSVRKFREAADAGDRDTAVQAMTTASRQLDKAASKGVIHKNQAANRKSAMAKRAASL
jgi:small subunit ribosomal protein S20